MTEKNNSDWEEFPGEIECACGRTHKIEIEEMDINSGAFDDLPRRLANVVGNPNHAGPVY